MTLLHAVRYNRLCDLCEERVYEGSIATERATYTVTKPFLSIVLFTICIGPIISGVEFRSAEWAVIEII